jgi:hypothetical protein
MKQKSETSSLIQSFFNLIKTQFSVSIKMIGSDNGSEFQMHSFYAQHGILHQKSCVGTPQQNATVERKHQHLLAVARALRFQVNLPLPFWGYCVLTATHLINRIPTPLLGNKSPFELLFNKIPNYSYLRVFGCLCYAATLPHNRHKFAPRSKQCMMLGYSQGIKGYRLYDLSTKQIFMSRDVIFYEHLFPFHTSQHLHTAHNTASLVLPHPITDMSAPISSVFFDIDNTTNSPLSTHSFTPLPDGSSPAAPSTSLPFGHNTHPSSAVDSSLPPASVISPENVIPDPPSLTLRKSTRIHKPPSYLQEFHCNNASLLPAPSPSSTPTNQGTASTNIPLSNYLSYSKLAPGYQSFILNASTIRESTSFHEANQDPHWCEAMQAELAALEANNTWSIQPLPSGKVPIGCKWVFKVKLRSDGSLERYKARLVAKGYNQQEGFDYFETFSPVAKFVTVRSLLAIAAVKGWSLYQLDVNNAFLYGELAEEVYMTSPPGLHSKRETSSNSVYRLTKSLYGLKQASRQWFSKFSTTLLSHGFTQSKADYCENHDPRVKWASKCDPTDE